ncbi:DUF6228 family protein [Nocardia sp. NPDC004711]
MPATTNLVFSPWDCDELIEFVDGLIATYRGWSGERTWYTNHLAIEASFSSGSHVEPRWTVSPTLTYRSWRAAVSTRIEAGEQMSVLAFDTRSFLTRGRDHPVTPLFARFEASMRPAGKYAEYLRTTGDGWVRVLLAHCMPGDVCDKSGYKALLFNWIVGRGPDNISPELIPIIERHARAAVILNRLHRDLRARSKRVPFPHARIGSAYKENRLDEY